MRPKTNDGRGQVLGPGPGTYETVPRSASGPKYSMRLKPDLYRRNEIPGPGAYDGRIESVGHKNPEWKIGKETRDRKVGDGGAPGPGHYPNERRLGQKGTRFGTSQRGKSAGTEGVPGPGNYHPDSEIDYRVKKKFGKTFGLKSEYGKFNENPAPGAYDPELKQARPSNPKYGFGSATRDDGSKNGNPAPGTYDPNVHPVKQAAPVWKMGTGQQRLNPSDAPKENPGPGTYDLNGSGGSRTGLIQEPKYSFGLKPDKHRGDDVPGPGAYDPNIAPAREHHPQTRIGKEQRGGSATNSTPGPGTYYDPSKSALKRIGAKIGTEERGKSLGKGDNVGPGTYDLMYDYSKNSFGKTMGSKLGNNGEKNNVGPGAYDPDLKLSRPNANSKSFGTSRNHMLPTTAVPGPGTYENKMSKTTPSWR